MYHTNIRMSFPSLDPEELDVVEDEAGEVTGRYMGEGTVLTCHVI